MILSAFGEAIADGSLMSATRESPTLASSTTMGPLSSLQAPSESASATVTAPKRCKAFMARAR